MVYPLFKTSPSFPEPSSHLASLSFIERYITERFLESLEGVKQDFSTILLIGSAFSLHASLVLHYPQAQFIVEPDITTTSQRADAIIILGYISHHDLSFFDECYRRLNNEGMIFMGTFGQDTYIEQEDLLAVTDMQSYGDRLSRAQFASPISTSLRLEFNYPDADLLKTDLDALGLDHLHPYLSEEGKAHLLALKSSDEPRALFLELILGHGIKTKAHLQSILTPIHLDG